MNKAVSDYMREMQARSEMKTLPVILRRWRRRRGLSQSQAARLLGVPVKSLQNWEHGRNTPGTLARAHLDQLLAKPS